MRLALGKDRTETALRFICASLNVLSEQESRRLDQLVVS
jgi:hypothetical protein